MSFVQASLSEMIERADFLYAKRSDIENVRLSVELLTNKETEDYEVAWRLGRAHFFLGQEAQNRSEARANHAQGIRACERAVALQPDRVEGQFWLGVNLALMAGLETLHRAIRHALGAKGALRRAIQIDPTYHGAGPLRVLGRIQQELPWLLGGGRNRARASFEKALHLAPHNTVTRIYFAELLLEMGDELEAQKQLDAILHAPSDSAWGFEANRDQKLAREKLTMMG